MPYIEYEADVPDVLARYLADGAVARWFQGRMESGLRALGNRSILADPRSVHVRDRINQTIKHRESWRPPAPTLLRSAASDLLGGTVDYP